MNIDDMIIVNNINQAIFDADIAIQGEDTAITNCINWLEEFEFNDVELEMMSQAILVILRERDNKEQ
jgi:hypothetical protein